MLGQYHCKNCMWTTNGLINPAMKPTKDLIRGRLLREGLGARIDREQFDLIGPDGIEIDPKVWPADIIEGTEIQILFWEENEAAEAEQAQNRHEQAQDQRQQDQDRREEAQIRRDQAQTPFLVPAMVSAASGIIIAIF